MNTFSLEADSSKIIITSGYRTFCNLCQRRIHKDEPVYSWVNSQFFIHLDCNDPEVSGRMHVVEFRKLAKKRKARKPKGKKKDNRKLHPSQNPERGVARSHGRGWRDIK